MTLAGLKARAKRLHEKIYYSFHQLPSVELDVLAVDDVGDIHIIEDRRNLPPRPDRGLFHDDITSLIRIVKTVDPANVLELGTGYGNATANICAHSSAHVYTVNALPENISGKITTFTLSKGEIGQVYRAHGFENRVTQIYDNTLNLDLGQYMELPIVDLAVLDACHDTEYVLNDFELVFPALRPGAVVLFHDTHPSRERHLNGSYDACIKLRQRGFDIKHIEGTWWGYWEKRCKPAPLTD